MSTLFSLRALNFAKEKDACVLGECGRNEGRGIYHGVWCPRTYTLKPATVNHFPLDIREKASGFTGKSASDLEEKTAKNPPLLPSWRAPASL